MGGRLSNLINNYDCALLSTNPTSNHQALNLKVIAYFGIKTQCLFLYLCKGMTKALTFPPLTSLLLGEVKWRKRRRRERERGERVE